MNVEKELFKAAPMVQHDGQSCPQKAHFLKASMEIHNSPSWIRKFQISQRHPQSTLKTSVQYLAPKIQFQWEPLWISWLFYKKASSRTRLMQISWLQTLFSFSFLKEEMMMMIPGNNKKQKKITTKEWEHNSHASQQRTSSSPWDCFLLLSLIHTSHTYIPEVDQMDPGVCVVVWISPAPENPKNQFLHEFAPRLLLLLLLLLHSRGSTTRSEEALLQGWWNLQLSPPIFVFFCLPDDTKDEEGKAHVMLDKEESKARVMLDTRKKRRFLNPQKQQQQQRTTHHTP